MHHGTVWTAGTCTSSDATTASPWRTPGPSSASRPHGRPADLPDNRFNYEKTTRWARCDSCHNFCAARARDYQPGSFVYAKDNTLAGPGKERKECFPSAAQRAALWANGGWDATYACRRCLPSFWRGDTQEIDRWLYFQHSGAKDHERIQNAARSRAQSSGWQQNQQWHRGSSWQQWRPE